MKKNPNGGTRLELHSIRTNMAKRCACCDWPRHARSLYCRRHFDHFVRHHSPTQKKPSGRQLAPLKRAAVEVLRQSDLGNASPELSHNIDVMRNWLYELLRSGRVHPNPRSIRRYQYERKLTHYLGLMRRDDVTHDDLLVSLGAVYYLNLADPGLFDDSHRGRQFRRCLGETLIKTTRRQVKVRVYAPRGTYNHELQLSEALGVFEYVGEMVLQALSFGLMQFAVAIGECEFPGKEWRNPSLTRLAREKPTFLRPVPRPIGGLQCQTA